MSLPRSTFDEVLLDLTRRNQPLLGLPTQPTVEVTSSVGIGYLPLLQAAQTRRCQEPALFPLRRNLVVGRTFDVRPDLVLVIEQ